MGYVGLGKLYWIVPITIHLSNMDLYLKEYTKYYTYISFSSLHCEIIANLSNFISFSIAIRMNYKKVGEWLK